ncbi:MAG TPA: HAMP domain-containing sensor histidine kinase [Chryseolinea sp.]|nr:HAMP domain-containing sensor histidine kinase [Chryseolinea sp.]
MANKNRLKILILEDSVDDAGLIEHALRKDNINFETERVDSREDFNRAIINFEPDVILSDHGLPQFNSIEALKISLKERAIAPFILVTGTVSEEFAATCLKLGADDYILKSNLSRLPSAVRRALKERKLTYLKREARRALRKQNTELIKVNKELDSFVYSVSHNLRAPLTSVMGLLNLMQREDGDHKFESMHEMMRTSIMRLDDTLKEIIQYSRNAHNDVECEETDLDELVQQTIKNLRYLDPEQSITWTINVQGDFPLKSDKTRLAVVLNNILANSIIYRNKDVQHMVGISAVVTYSELLLTVKDNGIGIKDSVLPRVFEMFYRGTERSQGSGLGLYIVKETTKRLGGYVDIDSVHQEGTTITIRVPNNEVCI